jgi:hypothetical protein
LTSGGSIGGISSALIHRIICEITIPFFPEKRLPLELQRFLIEFPFPLKFDILLNILFLVSFFFYSLPGSDSANEIIIRNFYHILSVL